MASKDIQEQVAKDVLAKVYTQEIGDAVLLESTRLEEAKQAELEVQASKAGETPEYIHSNIAWKEGEGYVIGTPEESAELAATLAERSGGQVLVVRPEPDYEEYTPEEIDTAISEQDKYSSKLSKEFPQFTKGGTFDVAQILMAGGKAEDLRKAGFTSKDIAGAITAVQVYRKEAAKVVKQQKAIELENRRIEADNRRIEADNRRMREDAQAKEAEVGRLLGKYDQYTIKQAVGDDEVVSGVQAAEAYKDILKTKGYTAIVELKKDLKTLGYTSKAVSEIEADGRVLHKTEIAQDKLEPFIGLSADSSSITAALRQPGINIQTFVDAGYDKNLITDLDKYKKYHTPEGDLDSQAVIRSGQFSTQALKKSFGEEYVLGEQARSEIDKAGGLTEFLRTTPEMDMPRTTAVLAGFEAEEIKELQQIAKFTDKDGNVDVEEARESGVADSVLITHTGISATQLANYDRDQAAYQEEVSRFYRQPDFAETAEVAVTQEVEAPKSFFRKAASFGMDVIPIVGTARIIIRSAEGGFSKGELANIALSGALDVVTILTLGAGTVVAAPVKGAALKAGSRVSGSAVIRGAVGERVILATHNVGELVKMTAKVGVVAPTIATKVVTAPLRFGAKAALGYTKHADQMVFKSEDIARRWGPKLVKYIKHGRQPKAKPTPFSVVSTRQSYNVPKLPEFGTLRGIPRSAPKVPKPPSSAPSRVGVPLELRVKEITSGVKEGTAQLGEMVSEVGRKTVGTAVAPAEATKAVTKSVVKGTVSTAKETWKTPIPTLVKEAGKEIATTVRHPLQALKASGEVLIGKRILNPKDAELYYRAFYKGGEEFASAVEAIAASGGREVKGWESIYPDYMPSAQSLIDQGKIPIYGKNLTSVAQEDVLVGYKVPVDIVTGDDLIVRTTKSPGGRTEVELSNRPREAPQDDPDFGKGPGGLDPKDKVTFAYYGKGKPESPVDPGDLAGLGDWRASDYSSLGKAGEGEWILSGSPAAYKPGGQAVADLPETSTFRQTRGVVQEDELQDIFTKGTVEVQARYKGWDVPEPTPSMIGRKSSENISLRRRGTVSGQPEVSRTTIGGQSALAGGMTPTMLTSSDAPSRFVPGVGWVLEPDPDAPMVEAISGRSWPTIDTSTVTSTPSRTRPVPEREFTFTPIVPGRTPISPTVPGIPGSSPSTPYRRRGDESPGQFPIIGPIWGPGQMPGQIPGQMPGQTPGTGPSISPGTGPQIGPKQTPKTGQPSITPSGLPRTIISPMTTTSVFTGSPRVANITGVNVGLTTGITNITTTVPTTAITTKPTTETPSMGDISIEAKRKRPPRKPPKKRRRTGWWLPDREEDDKKDPEQSLLVIQSTPQGAGRGNPKSRKVQTGKLVQVNAVPYKGWKFDHWEGDVEGAYVNQKSFMLRMDDDRTLVAVFIPSGVKTKSYFHKFYPEELKGKSRSEMSRLAIS